MVIHLTQTERGNSASPKVFLLKSLIENSLEFRGILLESLQNRRSPGRIISGHLVFSYIGGESPGLRSQIIRNRHSLVVLGNGKERLTSLGKIALLLELPRFGHLHLELGITEAELVGLRGQLRVAGMSRTRLSQVPLGLIDRGRETRCRLGTENLAGSVMLGKFREGDRRFIKPIQDKAQLTDLVETKRSVFLYLGAGKLGQRGLKSVQRFFKLELTLQADRSLVVVTSGKRSAAG